MWRSHAERIVSSAEHLDATCRSHFRLLMNTLRTKRLLVTSGATLEPIDEVRYLSNKSSGRLGCLIALMGAIEQYEVTLLHAHSSVAPSTHPRLRSIEFSSTRDLAAKLQEHWPSHDVLIMAAAVADFTQKGGQTQGKMRRADPPSIELTPTEDLIASIANNSRSSQHVIAFALERADELETAALEKLHRKEVDAIIANPLETMESTQITASVYCSDGRTIDPPKDMHKAEFAKWLIQNLNEITPSI